MTLRTTLSCRCLLKFQGCFHCSLLLLGSHRSYPNRRSLCKDIYFLCFIDFVNTLILKHNKEIYFSRCTIKILLLNSNILSLITKILSLITNILSLITKILSPIYQDIITYFYDTITYHVINDLSTTSYLCAAFHKTKTEYSVPELLVAPPPSPPPCPAPPPCHSPG